MRANQVATEVNGGASRQRGEATAGAPRPAAGVPASVDSVPAYLTAEAHDVFRPQTVQRLSEIVATPAITDCPVDLSQDEAKAILEMLESRQEIVRAWSRTLDWGIRYTTIAQRMAQRAGFSDYVGWVERRRIQPMHQLRRELDSRTAGLASGAIAEPV